MTANDQTGSTGRLKLSPGDKAAFIMPALAIIGALFGLYSRLAVVETRVDQLTHEISLLRQASAPANGAPRLARNQ